MSFWSTGFHLPSRERETNTWIFWKKIIRKITDLFWNKLWDIIGKNLWFSCPIKENNSLKEINQLKDLKIEDILKRFFQETDFEYKLLLLYITWRGDMKHILLCSNGNNTSLNEHFFWYLDYFRKNRDIQEVLQKESESIFRHLEHFITWLKNRIIEEKYIKWILSFFQDELIEDYITHIWALSLLNKWYNQELQTIENILTKLQENKKSCKKKPLT